MTAQALDASSITGISIGVIVVLVILGFVIGAIIAKLIVRAVVALVVVVLAIVVWQQRTHVRDEFNDKVCNANPTFFGVHIDPSDDVRRKCNISSN